MYATLSQNILGNKEKLHESTQQPKIVEVNQLFNSPVSNISVNSTTLLNRSKLPRSCIYLEEGISWARYAQISSEKPI